MERSYYQWPLSYFSHLVSGCLPPVDVRKERFEIVKREGGAAQASF
jgi:hypothetical protein